MSCTYNIINTSNILSNSEREVWRGHSDWIWSLINIEDGNPFCENLNLSQSNFVAHKVYVDLIVFDALMLNQIRRQINNTDIVTVYQGSRKRRVMKFTKEVAQQARLNNNISNTTILDVDTR